MRKLWLIARHEYIKRVTQKSFLLTLLGFPTLIIVIGAISALVAIGGGDSRPVGYVDLAELLDARALPVLSEEQKNFTEIQPYPDEAAAQDALKDGDIQAYYLVPEDYLQTKQLTLIYGEREPGAGAIEDFRDFVYASLAGQQRQEARGVLMHGLDLVIRSTDGRREMAEGKIIGYLLPFVMTFFLFFAISTAGGYLLQAMTEEKENRTMEIITTSVSPEQLMGGKSLGLIGVSLTQVLTWSVVLVMGILVGGQFLDDLRGVQWPYDMLVIIVLYFIPTFTLIAGIMIAIGGAVTEQQEGQQVAGIINMLFLLPIFFLTLLFSQPDSPFLVFLTLFPSTAFLTVLLRWGLASVPWWQMVVSWVVLVGSAIGSILVAARVFRMGMLRYGRRLSLRDIITGLLHRQMPPEKELISHA